MQTEKLTAEERLALEGLRSRIADKIEVLKVEISKAEQDLAVLLQDLAGVDTLLGPVAEAAEDSGEPKKLSPGTTARSERPKARVSHAAVIGMIADVLREAGKPLQLREIHARLEQKSMTEGLTLPGKGRLNNVGVHLTNYEADDILPVVRMPGGSLYGLTEETLAAGPGR